MLQLVKELPELVKVGKGHGLRYVRKTLRKICSILNNSGYSLRISISEMQRC